MQYIYINTGRFTAKTVYISVFIYLAKNKDSLLLYLLLKRQVDVSI